MTERRFLGIVELENYLGVSRNTIRYWVWKREIPFFRFGRRIKFDLRELEGWIKERKKEQIN